jgi:predicted RNA polymerase sigma factor
MRLHGDSRHEARLNAAGELVLPDEPERARWEQAKIHEGIAVLKAAFALYDPGPITTASHGVAQALSVSRRAPPGRAGAAARGRPARRLRQSCCA